MLKVNWLFWGFTGLAVIGFNLMITLAFPTPAKAQLQISQANVKVALAAPKKAKKKAKKKAVKKTRKKVVKPVKRKKVIVAPISRRRVYNRTIIYRPHGHWYYGYGHYYHDHEAVKWLTFTAITFPLLDDLNENQQRALEKAQIEATTAPIGEPVIWTEDGATGSVTAVSETPSESGLTCRTFVQEAILGGRTDSGTGTACLQEDGSWEMI